LVKLVLAHTDDDTDLETLGKRKIQVKSFFSEGKPGFRFVPHSELPLKTANFPSGEGPF
jgi:hypothetical protein